MKRYLCVVFIITGTLTFRGDQPQTMRIHPQSSMQVK